MDDGGTVRELYRGYLEEMRARAKHLSRWNDSVSEDLRNFNVSVILTADRQDWAKLNEQANTA